MNTKLYPLQFVTKEKECIDYSKLKSPDETAAAENAQKTECLCTENAFIAKGFLSGNTLDDAIETYLGNLLGDKVFQYYRGIFPLEVQLLKSKKDSPVVVNADDQTAGQRWNCWGKEKAFYILGAKEDATLYIGLERTVSAQELYEHSQKGSIKSLLNRIAPQEGELFYVKPGTPYCIGAGITLLEIAQNSPVELDLHNEELFAEALDFINLNAYIPEYEIPQGSNLKVEKLELSKELPVEYDELDSFHILVCTQGSAQIKFEGRQAMQISQEELMLFPHYIDDFTIVPDGSASFLKIYTGNLPDFKIEEGTEEEHEHHDGCSCGPHHDGHGHDECEHDGCEHDEHGHDDYEVE